MITPEKRRLKVFLCHAHEDREAVLALYTRLRRNGVDVWLDKKNLLPGVDWESEIRRAVKEADVVLVCLSKHINRDGFVQQEVRLAIEAEMEKREGEIFIIPTRLEECETLNSLRKWQWVDLFDENDGYNRLILALKRRAASIGATMGTGRKRKQSDTGSTNLQPEFVEVSVKAEAFDKDGSSVNLIELNEHWILRITWNVPAEQLRFLKGNWELNSYMEAIMPGPELKLNKEAVLIPINQAYESYNYSQEVALVPGTLQMGIYRIVALVTSKDENGKPTPAAGFADQLIVQFVEH